MYLIVLSTLPCLLNIDQNPLIYKLAVSNGSGK